jgi:NTE family protein
MLLSPISMRNNAGTCGYVQSELIDEALANRLTNPRQYRAARSFSQLQDPSKKFLHLVDGGISDNLGLRAGLDILEVTNSLQRTAEMMNAKVVDTLVVISVNAETDPDPSIDLSSAAPGFASMMNAVSGGQIRRINFDTLLLTQELVERLARESRDAGFPVETFLVAVDFEDFAEKANRRYFKRIPTSFNLSDDQVDELIWAGRDLLLASSEYRRLVGFLGGQLPERKPRPDND